MLLSNGHRCQPPERGLKSWTNPTLKGLLNGVIFLDLKKAFDTMDHEILLQKLKFSCMCQASLNWFASYLTKKTQKTFLEGVLSDSSTIKCRIPQGSILGPLLFIVCINDLPSCDLYSKVRCMQMISA